MFASRRTLLPEQAPRSRPQWMCAVIGFVAAGIVALVLLACQWAGLLDETSASERARDAVLTVSSPVGTTVVAISVAAVAGLAAALACEQAMRRMAAALPARGQAKPLAARE